MTDQPRDHTFPCSCGAHSLPPEAARHAWASYAALGDFFTLKWHHSEDAARRTASACMTTGAEFDVLEAPPTLGALLWASLGDHFATPRDALLWTLFETPKLARWGYDDEDVRLTDLALVECRVRDFEILSPQAGVARAEITRVVTLDDLKASPPTTTPATERDLWEDLRISRDVAATRRGDLIYLDASDDGMGGWAVVMDTPAATDLLLLSEYDKHRSHLWAGRLRVRDGTTWLGKPPPTALIEAVSGAT